MICVPEFTLTDNGIISPGHSKCTDEQSIPKTLAHYTSRIKRSMSSWLMGTSPANPPSVKHELACVLYDHFL